VDERGGQLSCYDSETSERIYRERLTGATCFKSSPWAYEGKAFCLADDGRTFVVKAGPEFKVLGTNDRDAMCWSSPAVGGGALFLRTVDNLYCIKNKKDKGSEKSPREGEARDREAIPLLASGLDSRPLSFAPVRRGDAMTDWKSVLPLNRRVTEHWRFVVFRFPFVVVAPAGGPLKLACEP
jgi:hypothetical protein